MTTDNFCFYLQNRLIQTSQTGGQRYSDTSPFSIPWWKFYSTCPFGHWLKHHSSPKLSSSSGTAPRPLLPPRVDVTTKKLAAVDRKIWEYWSEERRKNWKTFTAKVLISVDFVLLKIQWNEWMIEWKKKHFLLTKNSAFKYFWALLKNSTPSEIWYIFSIKNSKFANCLCWDFCCTNNIYG
jgi:hypothetical protein